MLLPWTTHLFALHLPELNSQKSNYHDDASDDNIEIEQKIKSIKLNGNASDDNNEIDKKIKLNGNVLHST